MWVNEYKVSLEKWLPLHDVEEVVGVDWLRKNRSRLMDLLVDGNPNRGIRFSKVCNNNNNDNLLCVCIRESIVGSRYVWPVRLPCNTNPFCLKKKQANRYFYVVGDFDPVFVLWCILGTPSVTIDLQPQPM